jgi:signal recognition particle subunit SRP54
LAAADLARPAAVEQLFTLGQEIGVPVVSEGKDPIRVARSALKAARRDGRDVLIVDTGGRLHVDADMMREARRIRDALNPHHVLMAADAMTGQDALRQARAFMAEIDLTGFLLTKLDGDARGGAALSVTGATDRPIFFVGVGERPMDLEPFHPDRMASRILGMGDVVSLVEKAQKEMDEEEARAQAAKLLTARFTLDDFLAQLRQVRKLGPLQDVLGMLPGAGQLKDVEVDEGELGRTEAIICSMTRQERARPEVIDGSRRSRIARGSGTSVAQVNTLLKRFDGARKMMKQLSGGGLLKGLKGLKGLPIDPGAFPQA